MKKIIVAFIALSIGAFSAEAQKKSGAIQFETVLDPAAMATASGFPVSEEMKARLPKSIKSDFELLFTATQASYMPVEEAEDSNGSGGGAGGGMGRMMMRFGGAGGAREYFYSFADQKLVEVFDLSDTTYAMPSKLTVAVNLPTGGLMGARPQSNATAQAPAATNAVVYLPGPPTIEIVKTEETKKIIGFNCNKVIVKSIRKAKVLDMERDVIDETAVWYTNELGFNFSPNPNLWTEGTVLAIENRGNTTTAKSIEYRGVSAKDVNPPKKAIAITADEYKTKMEAMMKRFGGGRPGAQGGPVRSVIIN